MDHPGGAHCLRDDEHPWLRLFCHRHRARAPRHEDGADAHAGYALNFHDYAHSQSMVALTPTSLPFTRVCGVEASQMQHPGITA